MIKYLEMYKLLELALGEHFECNNVVVCSSGTAALHLALESFELKPNAGFEVIIPDYTMVAVARAVTLAGLVPVFADCKHDLTIDPNSVRELITDKTVAVIAVHTFARQCDMVGLRSLLDVVKRTNNQSILLIEDNAEAHGLRPSKKADATCWSFYKNKTIAGEEGGAINFGDSSYHKSACDYAKRLRCLGFTENHDYTHHPRGHNYRMSNLHASAIFTSLKNIQTKSLEVVDIYKTLEEICPFPWWCIFKLDQVHPTPWVFPIKISGGFTSQDFVVKRSLIVDTVKILNNQNIQARCGFWPMSLQQEYQAPRYFDAEKNLVNKNAWHYGNTILYLPLVYYTRKQQEDLVTVLKKVERGLRDDLVNSVG